MHSKSFKTPLLLFLLFGVYTFLIKTVDVQPIGPLGSSVGFASINGPVSNFIGYSEFWYEFTQILGWFAILVCGIFGLIGLSQWVHRKNILKVDVRIITLGFFYILVISIYVFFLFVAVNYRPVLSDGELEASFPSSHTMLLLTVMLTP